MYNYRAFEGDPSKYIGRPLYIYNLDDPAQEDEILNFINLHYKEFIEGECGTNRRAEQTDNLAAYLGFAPKENNMILTENSGPIWKKPTFRKLRTHPIKYLTDNLVARLILNKPNYQIYTINRNVLDEKRKTRTASKIAKSIFADPEKNNLFKEYIRQAIIMAESYIEVFWNINKGKRTGTKEVELLDANGNPAYDSKGKPIIVKKRLNQGDCDIRLRDPRFVITQHANSPEASEWAILFEYLPVEKLQIMNPEKADCIKIQPNLDDLAYGDMEYTRYTNYTIYYKLYHRPTPEMPDGRIIEATPTCILRNTPYPHQSWIDKELFPIVSLRTVKLVGSERGSKSIVAQGKGLQIAKNNLLNRAIDNLIKFPPFRVWEDRSLDQDKLRVGVPTDVNYMPGGTPPRVETAHVLTNEELELMKMIDSDLLKIFTVAPTSIGDTMPNMRSREMFDFVQEQENKQSFPIEDDIRDALITVAQLYIGLAADEYRNDDETRLVRYYGDRNKLVQEEFDPEDLKEMFDIRIDTSGRISDTFQGKVQQLGQLVQIPGMQGLVSPQWMLDKFELGDTDEMLNVLTGGVDLARKHLSMILDGKSAPSPQKWVDLVPYYEEFMKKLQIPEILDILDERGYSYYLEEYRNPEKELRGNDLIAFRILDQVNTIETLLFEAMQQQQMKGMVDPQTGKPPLLGQIYTKFPAFPSVYIPDPVTPIDPMKEAQQAVPQGSNPPMPGAPPSNMPPTPPNPQQMQ